MLVVLVLARLLLPLFSRAELSVSVSFFFLFGNFTFIVTTTCVIYCLHFFWVMQKCIVDVPGGSLEIEWREDDNHVYMTATAEAVMAQVRPTAMPHV